METPEVTMYGANATGERISSFRTAPGLRVSVYPNDRDANETAFEYACELARRETEIAATNRLRSEVERLTDELTLARAELATLKQLAPARLMGTGYVRFTTAGAMWLLGKRESGWAAFGYRLADWDELFRRYNVRVTGHGTDEHGAWWSVENVS